jgi:hypothetical protein
MFIVRRLTDLGLITIPVARRGDAVLWARHLHERWGESTWIEQVGFPAAGEHDLNLLHVRAARLSSAIEPEGTGD